MTAGGQEPRNAKVANAYIQMHVHRHSKTRVDTRTHTDMCVCAHTFMRVRLDRYAGISVRGHQTGMSACRLPRQLYLEDQAISKKACNL